MKLNFKLITKRNIGGKFIDKSADCITNVSRNDL